MEIVSDWRDGFLFVGNQVSLDFLNTRPVVEGSPVELLPDCSALLRWLAAAGVRGQKAWVKRVESDMALVHEFRERFRKVILEVEGGGGVSGRFMDYVNEVLGRSPYVDEVVRVGDGWGRRRRFEILRPVDVLGPVADGAAELLVNGDLSRIRKCDACVLHFLDVSKKGNRRWCSMQMCGNRSKVAAYAARVRGDSDRTV